MDISIIVPVYNVEDYIERCVLSIINQAYSDIKIECILVDDNSPDLSLKKARRLIDQYSGDIIFRTIRHERNLGLSSARNTGMRNATGKYLYFLDSDDDIDKLCIQKLWDVVLKYPGIQMVMGNYYDRRIGKDGINKLRIPNGIINNYQLLEMYYIGYIPVVAWNSLILRDVIDENNLSFKEGLIHEDLLWSLQLFLHINYFYFVPEITLYYEFNPKSIMTGQSNNDTSFLTHHLIIIDESLKCFRNNHCVTNSLYILSELLIVLDCLWKDNNSVDEDSQNKIIEYRSVLYKMSLSNYRFILSLFELVMYRPFGYILKSRFFRKNYHKIKIVIYRISSFFDFLHRKDKNLSLTEY